MKGDFSRHTFKPEKHYSGVRMQQGRVLLDADWNEQVDIANHRLETEAGDAIGLCGAPEDNAGFKIEVVGGKELNILAGRDQDNGIIPGRFYVDGILCEIDKDYKFTDQPDLRHVPLPAPSPNAAAFYLAYLDVWQHHLTVLDDADLHEVALEAPDTTTRTKTVWQVKLLPLTIPESEAHCGKDFAEWKNLTKPRAVRLAAQATPLASVSTDPCAVAPKAGFSGVANQLYRVEIHTPGPLGTAKFKWSRDNGSIVGRVKEIDPGANMIVLCEPPRDDRLAFQRNDWVEVINDDQERRREAGILARLNYQTQGTSLIYDPDSVTPPGAMPRVEPPSDDNPKTWKVRKWHPAETAAALTSSHWQELGKDGVEVMFDDKGAGDKEYKVGDYWLIPARTVTGNVDWPVDGAPKSLEPFGIKHHYCRLAICKLDQNGNWHVDDDCRPIFTPLVDQINLFYLSGDGQEAMPGEILPQPLRVGVANGLRRVAGARVKFEVKEGRGSLYKDKNGQTPFSSPAQTDQNGIVECYWKLGGRHEKNPYIKNQYVEVTLLDASGAATHLSVRFNANLSLSSEVVYDVLPCGNLPLEPPTVQSLLRSLPGWPVLDANGNTSVRYVLDTLLCMLNARHLPFLDQCENAPYEFGNWQTIDGALQTNTAHLAANTTDRRQFVPLLAQTLPCLRHRDGRNYSFAIPYPTGLVFDGRYIWAGSVAETRLYRIDELANDPAGRIKAIETTGLTYYGAFDGERVWFTSPYKIAGTDPNDQVFFINTGDANPTAQALRVGMFPVGISFDGVCMWVANYLSKTVSIILAGEQTVIRTITLRGEDGKPVAPTNLAFDGRYMWIGGEPGSIFRVKKTENGLWADPELVDDQLEIFPRELAFDGSHLWVVNCFDESKPPIYKIDVHTLAVTRLDDSRADIHGAVFDGRHIWLQAANSLTSHLRDVYSRLAPGTRTLKTWAVGHDATVLFKDGKNSWQRQNVPAEVTANLNAIFFIDGEIGWAVGNDATILRTINGGTTWTQATPPAETTSHLHGVFFNDNLNGWVVGDHDLILATTDGGKSWKKQNATTTAANLHGVHFINQKNGWVVGSHAAILATNDGGEHWTKQNPPPGVSAHLRDVYFLFVNPDLVKGWAVGQNGVILLTTDGGKNWSIQASIIITEHLNAVHFTASGLFGWVVGNNATLLNTRDGGVNWEKVSPLTPVTAHLNGLHLTTDTIGHIVGAGATILINDDTPRDWKISSPPDDAGLMRKVDAGTNNNAGVISLDRPPLNGVFDGTHLWLSMANHRVQKWLVG